MSPQGEAILEIFKSTGAYLQGHFKLTSGLHSAEYLQSALVLQHPAAAEKLGRLMAEQLREFAPHGVRFVASPAIGGLIIGHEVARAMGARFIFTERDPATKKMMLRRGFSVTPGELGVMVEDVITTGGTTVDVIETLQNAGAKVLAAASVIDRSGGHVSVGVPRVALATLQVAAHYPEHCPMCALGIPVVKPGSRPA